MSVGNLPTQGDKKNNFPYQLAVLKLLDAINSSIGALPGVDYETRTTMYQAIAAGPGYSISDIIVRYDIIDVATSTLTATIWFNQTTQTAIAAPAPANLVPMAAPSSVTVINGAGGAAVNIQDGGNSITIDNINLDTPLSTLNKEVTQLLIHTLLTTIDGDTSNLDVALSTRATEATLATRLSKADFEARINTLGQKTMALSTPVVLASDQVAIPVTLSGSTTAQTYSASIIGLVTGALATDIFSIIGSATKTINVQRIVISAVRAVNGSVDIVLVKRSTANTLGTSTTPTVVPHDSTNTAGTAVVRAYTVNPTLGTLVGNMRAEKQFINTTGGAASSDKLIWVSGPDSSQPLVILNGIAETLAVNLVGVTIAGSSFDIHITWTES